MLTSLKHTFILRSTFLIKENIIFLNNISIHASFEISLAVVTFISDYLNVKCSIAHFVHRSTLFVISLKGFGLSSIMRRRFTG